MQSDITSAGDRALKRFENRPGSPRSTRGGHREQICRHSFILGVHNAQVLISSLAKECVGQIPLGICDLVLRVLVISADFVLQRETFSEKASNCAARIGLHEGQAAIALCETDLGDADTVSCNARPAVDVRLKSLRPGCFAMNSFTRTNDAGSVSSMIDIYPPSFAPFVDSNSGTT
jgi:hypothetical protein